MNEENENQKLTFIITGITILGVFVLIWLMVY
jgi:hypothetical protein